MKNTTQLEDIEQAAFVEWLELNGFKFTAVPNSTYTKSQYQKIKNHRTGLRAGFPDMIVIINPSQSKDGEGYFICIEMKRVKGSSTSNKQKEWHTAINDLRSDNVVCYVAYGAEQAIKVVAHYVKNVEKSPF